MDIAVRESLGPKLLGLDAPRALTLLLSSLKGVEEVCLAELRPLPHLQTRRNLTPAERTVFERGLKCRQSTGLDFWDAVLLQLPSVPDAIGLLDEAMMHVTFRGRERYLSWTSAVDGGLERACAEFSPKGEASLTFLSEVRCHDGTRRHIPMIDFHAASSAPQPAYSHRYRGKVVSWRRRTPRIRRILSCIRNSIIVRGGVSFVSRHRVTVRSHCGPNVHRPSVD